MGMDKRVMGLPSYIYGAGIGPLQALPALLVELGRDPEQVFAEAGVDIRLFDDPTNTIPYDALGRLVETSVAVTGCQHLGLLLGKAVDPLTMGDIWSVMRHSPTIGKACRRLVLHLHLQDRGAVPLLLPVGPTRVAIGYSVLRYETPAIKHIHEGGLAIMYAMMRRLCGPEWTPLLVQFSHRAPNDSAPYRQCFGARVQFDAEYSAVVFAAEWMERAVPGADPAEHERLLQLFAAREGAIAFGLAHKVRRALQSMVFSGTASTDGIAHLFELHERTLRRRLADEGTSVQQLLQETTTAVAQQLLRETHLSISEVAAALHYGDTAAFSNAFKRWAGCGPNEWRKRQTALR